jgi:hypothetical protein
MYRYTPLPHLIHEKEDVLRDQMIGTFMEENGNLARVWAKLDISSFSWYRYVKVLGIGETLRAIRDTMRHGPDYRPRKH